MTGTRTMRFKPSLKQTVSDHEKAIRWMCNMAGKPIPAEFAERAPEPAKPKSTRKPPTPTDKSQLEAAVQREVFSVLAKHPSVLFAVRQNSGAAETESGRSIWFYRWARRRGVEMVLVDFWGLFTDGRMFALECKKRKWKRSLSDDRENKQQAFIDVVKSAGGVGGFVTSGEDALALLS